MTDVTDKKYSTVAKSNPAHDCYDAGTMECTQTSLCNM